MRRRAAEQANAMLQAENEERRRAEEALRASQAATRKLSLVASSTDNLVAITDPTGRIEWVNESAVRLFELSFTELVGRELTALLAGPDTGAPAASGLCDALRRAVSFGADLGCRTREGRTLHLHLDLQPVRNESGEVENFIAIMVDITTRVETEQHLRRAKDEADAASRAKSEFLASMSHEIRTPMNGVIGMTSLLLETPLTPEQRECVNTIRTSGDALLSIINDILDFSKIESGRMELEQHPIELAVCLEQVLDLFAVQAAARAHRSGVRRRWGRSTLDPRGPHPPAPDHRQPGEQRHQVHSAGLRFHRGAAARAHPTRRRLAAPTPAPPSRFRARRSWRVNPSGSPSRCATAASASPRKNRAGSSSRSPRWTPPSPGNTGAPASGSPSAGGSAN